MAYYKDTWVGSYLPDHSYIYVFFLTIWIFVKAHPIPLRSSRYMRLSCISM